MTLSSKFLIRLKRQICPQFGRCGLKEAISSASKFPHISPTRRRSIGEKWEPLLQGTLPCNHLTPLPPYLPPAKSSRNNEFRNQTISHRLPECQLGRKEICKRWAKRTAGQKRKCTSAGEERFEGIIISAGGKFNKDFLTTLNQHTMGIVCKH